MQGLLELLFAIAMLVWVIGPLARWQYEYDQREQIKNRQLGNDSASSCEEVEDPLASHPYFRAAKFRT